jgi:GT2 family glycosyltransferase
MLHMLRPTGTEIQMNCGLNVSANFNAGIRRALANPAVEWVWIMGDDHQFEADALIRLLDRDLDIVVPLVVRRQPPFIPVLFRYPESDTPIGQFPPHHWHQLPSTGLLEVYTAGSAGMLIRRHVLESIGDPWFETGKMGSDLTNEDTYFCKKAQDAGFKIYADMDVQMDHWTPVSFRPIRTAEGQWTVAINLGNDIQVALPPSWLLQLVQTVKEESKENFGLLHGVTDA